MDRTNPPDLQTLKAYPTPREGSRLKIFLLKWRERMNLRYPEQFYPWLCVFEHQGENCLGGLLQPPFGELGLIIKG